MHLIRPKQRSQYLAALAAISLVGFSLFVMNHRAATRATTVQAGPVVARQLADQPKPNAVTASPSTPAYVDHHQPSAPANTSNLALSTPQAAAPTPPQPKLTTITGLVAIDPATPVCQATVACSEPVANHTIQVVDSSGQVIAQNQTDATGSYSFTLQLPLGTYNLVLLPTITVPGRYQPVYSVTTTPGIYAYNYDILIDTGIR